MPLYTYKCHKCGQQVEEFRSVDQRDDTPNLMHFDPEQDTHGQNRECKGMMRRVYTPQYNAAIPGIYNRVNRHWNEDGNQTVDDVLLKSGLHPEDV